MTENRKQLVSNNFYKFLLISISILGVFLISLFIIHNPARADITTGLVGWWKFDEGSGTAAADSSENNNTGTLTNGSTWTTGKIGGALSFDGTDDNVNISDFNTNLICDSNTYTIAAWVYSDENGRMQYVFDTYGYWHLGFGKNSGNVMAALDNGNLIGKTTIIPGQWYHVAIAASVGGVGKIYVNGVDDTQSGTPTPYVTCTTGAAIGKIYGGSNYWHGLIDDVRFYNRVLSASEIQELYNYTGGGTPTPTPTPSGTPTPDTTPPIIFNGSPSGTLAAGVTQTTIAVVTDENATCRYSTTANIAYTSMSNTLSTTGGTNYSTIITGLSNGNSYTRYVRCQDSTGNANTSDYTISFSVASAVACTGNSNYDCVTCAEGETGFCRQPKDLTLVKVQAAVNDSIASNGTVYGDGVYLIAGTQTWASGLDISNKKGLVLKGSGASSTILNTTGNNAVIFSGADHARITGINFNTAASSQPIFGWGLDFRVDHCLFTGAFSIGIFWYDGHHNTGLVDSNTFTFTTNGGTAVYVRGLTGYITTPIDFGSGDWVFVENNIFNNLGNPEMVENQNLGKIVNRYNTYNEISPSNMQTLFEQHNTGEGEGGRAQEVYNNRINFNSPVGDFIRMLYWRHGTGLVYKNLVDYSGRGAESLVYFQLRAYRAAGGINHNDFSDETDCANWSTNTANYSAPSLGAGMLAKCCSTSYAAGGFIGEGYPCVGQPGQGVYGGAHEPIYFWDNKKTADGTTLVDLASSNVLVQPTEQWAIQLNRDYCVFTTGKPASCGGHPLVYTPYTCPHPLTGLTGTCDSTVAGTAGYDIFTIDTIPPAAPGGVTVN
jgi:hypothetical protein